MTCTDYQLTDPALLQRQELFDEALLCPELGELCMLCLSCQRWLLVSYQLHMNK